MVKYGKLLHGAFGEKGMCAFREGVTFIYVQVSLSGLLEHCTLIS